MLWNTPANPGSAQDSAAADRAAERPVERSLPPIDAEAPLVVATATFAFG